MKKILFILTLGSLLLGAQEPTRRNKSLIIRVDSCKENRTPSFQPPETEPIDIVCFENGLDFEDGDEIANGLSENGTVCAPFPSYETVGPSLLGRPPPFLGNGIVRAPIPPYETVGPSFPGRPPPFPGNGIVRAPIPPYERHDDVRQAPLPICEGGEDIQDGPFLHLYTPETPPYFGKVERKLPPPFLFSLFPKLYIPSGISIYCRHLEGKWIKNNMGYSTLGIFASFPWSQKITFLDCRLHFSNEEKWGGNLGIGIRVPSGNTMWGANLFYDFWEKDKRGAFHQVGVGLERLGCLFDIRINCYLPFKDSRDSKKESFKYEDDFSCFYSERKKVLKGVELEFGSWLKRQTLANCCSCYAGVGVYTYDAEHKRPFVGGSLRILTNFGKHLTLLCRGGFDKVFHLSGLISLSLTYPFAPSGNDPFFLPVFRQERILLGRKRELWHWNW